MLTGQRQLEQQQTQMQQPMRQLQQQRQQEGDNIRCTAVRLHHCCNMDILYLNGGALCLKNFF